jgi:hypothetical protein
MKGSAMMYQTTSGHDETTTPGFQPDVLLPIQYFESVHRKSRLDPEQRLMLAILEDGVACFQKYAFAQNRRGKNLFGEAEEWLAEKDNDYVFGFENICEVLGVDAAYLRLGLLEWREREFAKIHKVKSITSSSLSRRTSGINHGRNRIAKASGAYQEKKAVGFR